SSELGLRASSVNYYSMCMWWKHVQCVRGLRRSDTPSLCGAEQLAPRVEQLLQPSSLWFSADRDGDGHHLVALHVLADNLTRLPALLQRNLCLHLLDFCIQLQDDRGERRHARSCACLDVGAVLAKSERLHGFDRVL